MSGRRRPPPWIPPGRPSRPCSSTCSARWWTGALVAREASAFSRPRVCARLARLRRCLARRVPARHGGGALGPHPVLQARRAAPAQPRAHPAALRVAASPTRSLHDLEAGLAPARRLARRAARRSRGSAQEFLIAPVSNGNISLMVDLARRNDFPWDAILGAEIAGDYKPKPRVYLAACEAFDLRAVAMRDGRGAQQTTLPRPRPRPAHRPCRTAERAGARQGRAEADRAGRCGGEGLRRFGGEAGGLRYSPSCPALCRASTSYGRHKIKDVDGRDKRAFTPSSTGYARP